MPLISDEFDTLTKDQQYILSVLYKDYLECVKLGSVKLTCNNFGSAKDIHTKYFQKLHFEDVKYDLNKLKNSGFLNGVYASNTIYHVTIS
ncbi:hypothetical protein, partial [Staphylococcus aureus]